MNNTTATGRHVEQAVARHMQGKGYTLLESNWRTRWCEIDLIMSKKKTIYFIEVKYRKNAHAGHGFEYITPKKVSQLYFAVDYWCSVNKYEGDVSLLGASVDGETSRLLLVPIERQP